jgi:hypothetical protein
LAFGTAENLDSAKNLNVKFWQTWGFFGLVRIVGVCLATKFLFISDLVVTINYANNSEQQTTQTGLNHWRFSKNNNENPTSMCWLWVWWENKKIVCHTAARTWVFEKNKLSRYSDWCTLTLHTQIFRKWVSFCYVKTFTFLWWIFHFPFFPIAIRKTAHKQFYVGGTKIKAEVWREKSSSIVFIVGSFCCRKVFVYKENN